MRNFKPHEFQGSFQLMLPELLFKLDDLRDELGCELSLSKHPNAFARNLGPDNLSQHNIGKWLLCRALDGYIPSSVTYDQFYQACRKIGFTGIGLYSGWSKRGFHIDLRDNRTAENPAVWAGIYDRRADKTNYVHIRELLNA